MSSPEIEEALAGYKKMHRAMLTATAGRWHDLDISMQQLRALYLLRDEDEASVGRLAEFFGIGLPAASLLADRLVRSGLGGRGDDPAGRRRVVVSPGPAEGRLVPDPCSGR